MTKLEYYLSVTTVYSIARVTRSLPWKTLQMSGEYLGQFAYLISKKYRRIALDNLRLAFGEDKNEVELISIARETYKNLGKSLCEALGSIQFSPAEIKKLINIEGKEHLENAYRRGKGIIAFSAHLGNFALLGIRLAAEGYPVNIILQEPEVKEISRIFHINLNHHGVNVIQASPRRKTTAESLKHLRQHEIICILGDQRELHSGVFVKFFNHPAGTATGPVVLAMRTGAEIVPAFLLRSSSNKLSLVIEHPFKLAFYGKKNEDIYENTQGLSKIVENYVRSFPEQWFWLHKRWES